MVNDPVATARGSDTSAAYEPKRHRRCAAPPSGAAPLGILGSAGALQN